MRLSPSRAEIGAPADLPLAAERPSESYGSKAQQHRSKDILGRVSEYFLGQFASAEGKKGGQFDKSHWLEASIRANLKGLGYGG